MNGSEAMNNNPLMTGIYLPAKYVKVDNLKKKCSCDKKIYCSLFALFTMIEIILCIYNILLYNNMYQCPICVYTSHPLAGFISDII